MNSVGQRIRYAIQQAGLKQADIQRATGVTRSAVSQWISGDIITVKAEYLFLIADATGFEARWLATGKGPQLKQQEDERKKAIDLIYGQLDERGRQAVLRVAESESQYALPALPKAGNHDC